MREQLIRKHALVRLVIAPGHDMSTHDAAATKMLVTEYAQVMLVISVCFSEVTACYKSVPWKYLSLIWISRCLFKLLL